MKIPKITNKINLSKGSFGFSNKLSSKNLNELNTIECRYKNKSCKNLEIDKYSINQPNEKNHKKLTEMVTRYKSSSNISPNIIESNVMFTRKKNKKLSLYLDLYNEIHGFYKNKSEKEFSELFKKNESYNSYIMLRKKVDEMPILSNSPITFNKAYNNKSEKERDKNNMISLYKLKTFLDYYWPRRHEIVTEFFLENKLIGERYYNANSLENFANYIKDNISNENFGYNIDTRLKMEEIISKGIYYDNLKINLNNKKINFNKEYLETNRDYYKKKIQQKPNNVGYFLNKNYKGGLNTIINKNYSDLEKKTYFSGKKLGTLKVFDETNLVNSLKKQTKFNESQKKESQKNIRDDLHYSNPYLREGFNTLSQEVISLKKKIKEKENLIKFKDAKKIKSLSPLEKKICKNSSTETIFPSNKKVKELEEKEKTQNNKEYQTVKKNKKLLEFILYQKVNSQIQFYNDCIK